VREPLGYSIEINHKTGKFKGTLSDGTKINEKQYYQQRLKIATWQLNELLIRVEEKRKQVEAYTERVEQLESETKKPKK